MCPTSISSCAGTGMTSFFETRLDVDVLVGLWILDEGVEFLVTLLPKLSVLWAPLATGPLEFRDRRVAGIFIFEDGTLLWGLWGYEGGCDERLEGTGV